MNNTPICGEQGQALVEAAISLALLLTMLIGVIEGALMFSTYHYLAYAARSGTRYAMVRGSKCTGFGTACPAGASDVETYVQNISYLGIDPTKVTVTTTWSTAPPAGSTCGTTACNDPGDQVTVQVSYPLSPFSVPFVPGSSASMHSSSTMVIAQ